MELPAGIRIVRQMPPKSMTGQELDAKLLMIWRLRFAQQKIRPEMHQLGGNPKWADRNGYCSNLSHPVTI